MLERWRERDVFHESSAAARAPSPSCSTRARPPPTAGPASHHVLSAGLQGRVPALPDHARAPRAPQGRLGLPRPAGRARDREGARLHSPRRTSSATGWPSSTPSAASRCCATSTSGTQLTERIGFWLDTDDAYFTLDDSYIESVWWSLKQVWDKGLLYEGHKVVPYCPRCGTALSSPRGGAGLQGRGGPVGLRALPGEGRGRACRCSAGPPRRGRCSPTPRWR